MKRLNEMNFDGINGDTMSEVPIDFFNNKYNPSHPMAIEPEGEAQGNTFWWSAMGWGYYHEGGDNAGEPVYDQVPVVSLQKWLSYRGEHMVNINERWAHERFGPMQMAHFNGIGYESWEDVWGIWNGITPRAGEALRRLSTNWRFLGEQQITHNFEEWIPHTEQVGPRENMIFASKFTGLKSDDKESDIVFMIVNRGDNATTALITLNENEQDG
jgi:hypothetical protein